MNLLYCDCGEVIGKYWPATQEQPAEACPWDEDLYDEEHNCYCCPTCFERMQEPDEGEAA